MDKIPKEAKMDLIYEIMLAVGNDKYVTKATGARADFFGLIRAIVCDEKFPCTTHQRLIGALKKTAVWQKVLPFLESRDRRCKVCGHHDSRHGGWGINRGTAACTHSAVVYSPGPTYHPCTCTKFIQRELK